MNYRMVGKFIGKILMVEAVFMIPSLFLALWDGEPEVVRAFAFSMAITLVLSLFLSYLGRSSQNKFLCQGRFGLCRTQLDRDESCGVSSLLVFRGDSELRGRIL